MRWMKCYGGCGKEQLRDDESSGWICGSCEQDRKAACYLYEQDNPKESLTSTEIYRIYRRRYY